MRQILSCLGIVLALVHLSQQVPEEDKKDYYVGAVVEYTPQVVWNSAETLVENAKLYAEFIKNATLQGADIIVFPEDGLTSFFFPEPSKVDSWTTFVPTAEEKYNPCTQNRAGISKVMKSLSCAARENKIYVVVNLVEKVLRADKVHYYNTNVVFDRNGQIIARYRKINLTQVEKDFFDVDKQPKIVTFDTDFGVRFGTSVCFDIFFSTPGLNMTRDLGITDFVYTTAWFSEVPFLTAVQIQFGWAFAEDVNFLASGYNNPSGSNTGSGIYLGRDGIANATLSYTNGRKMLVSRVPKKAPRQESKEHRRQNSGDDRGTCYMTDLRTPPVHGVLLMLDIFDEYESAVVNGPLFNRTLCHAGFCCNIEVNSTLSQSPFNHYRAVVYKGCRHYDRTNSANGIRVCGLIQCSNSSLSSCGIVQEDDVRFNSVKITATYNDDLSNSQLMPSILDTKLLPFDDFSYVEEKADNITRLTLAVDTPKDDLVAFAIYTRDYWYDHIV
ncbi:vanin-like protein 1 [Lasioglossum baleicum]|uniref:vanin-like protein 1 n=1 Tax=Lasioglossum baleicum TaxID=434251 RepID=UPI003FCD9A00